MQYYLLELRSKEETDTELVGTTYDANRKVVGKIFQEGISIKSKVKSPFTVILDDRASYFGKKVNDRIALDTNDTGTVLLISPAAKLVFEGLNLPVEFIEVSVKGKKLDLPNYFLVNVIGRINCVDREKSQLRYLRDEIIRTYNYLVLDVTRIPKNADMFLLGEDITMKVVVSQKVKDAVESAGLSGFEFKLPEEFKTFR